MWIHPCTVRPKAKGRHGPNHRGGRPDRPFMQRWQERSRVICSTATVGHRRWMERATTVPRRVTVEPSTVEGVEYLFDKYRRGERALLQGICEKYAYIGGTRPTCMGNSTFLTVA
eukprot:4837937-Amphidinium_carterae.1